jgi:hypothetical protein
MDEISMDNLNKDKSIFTLIEYLSQKYGRDNFKVKDYWNGDKCAIGLTDISEKYLIYISTIGLKDSGYYVALENPSKNDELPYEAVGEFNNLSLSELDKIFKEHLRIR